MLGCVLDGGVLADGSRTKPPYMPTPYREGTSRLTPAGLDEEESLYLLNFVPSLRKPSRHLAAIPHHTSY